MDPSVVYPRPQQSALPPPVSGFPSRGETMPWQTPTDRQLPPIYSGSGPTYHNTQAQQAYLQHRPPQTPQGFDQQPSGAMEDGKFGPQGFGRAGHLPPQFPPQNGIPPQAWSGQGYPQPGLGYNQGGFAPQGYGPGGYAPQGGGYGQPGFGQGSGITTFGPQGPSNPGQGFPQFAGVQMGFDMFRGGQGYGEGPSMKH